MKYKLGDFIKVKSNLIVDKSYGSGLMFIKSMVPFLGKSLEVTSIEGDYGVKLKGSSYTWTKDMLEDTPYLVYNYNIL